MTQTNALRRIRSVFTLGFFLLIVLGCGREERGRTEQADPIRIGVFLPLTGQMQPYGINAQEGLALALEEVNANGGIGGRPVQIHTADDKGEQVETLNAVKLLVERQGVRFLIGGLTSSGTMDAAAYAKEKEVLLFSPAASHPDIPKTGFPFFFRNWQSDALAGEAAARFTRSELKATRVAIVYVSNAYGHGQRDAFAKEFEALGGKVTIQKGFEQNDLSVIRSLLTAVKSDAPDAVFMPAYPKEYQEILLQAANLDLRVPKIATDTFDDRTLIEGAKDAAEGVYYTVAAAADPEYRKARDFGEKYRRRFKTSAGQPKDPGLVSDTAYDALHLVVNAIKAVGPHPAKVADALRSQAAYEGASGITTFTETGDIVKPIVVMLVKGGKSIFHKRM